MVSFACVLLQCKTHIFFYLYICIKTICKINNTTNFIGNCIYEIHYETDTLSCFSMLSFNFLKLTVP